VADVLEQLRTALGDRYEVDRLVGEGGMATVFLAKDLRHGRKVAIKTLRAELAASIGADRFLREIRLAANLQHPNVLALYDSGEADGLLYYVMPFIEGESLRDRLNREQQLPLHDAVRITREAAEGLAYAHEHGVVHRDIKPENILLQNGHALVADFGIARAADAAGEKLTQTGMAVGTPHYMSPEQSLGADHADVRSDVYSLGCVLYELLVGQPPFDGPNSRAILARHAMEQVPSLQVVRQTVPDELEDAVMQALEKTPADRFQKMSDFGDVLADLEPTLATRRTSSRGVPAVRRGTSGGTAAVRRGTSGGTAAVRRTTPQAILGTKWGSGARLWSVAAGVLVLLGLAGLGAYRTWVKPAGASQASSFDPNRIAVMYFRSRGGSDSLEFLAEGLTEALIHELSEVAALQVISRNGVLPFKSGAATPDSVGRALEVGTLVEGSLAQAGDRLQVSVSLINAENGEEIGSRRLERPREEIFALQDDLAKEVAIFLRQRLGQEIEVRQSRGGTQVTKAWELAQRAEKLKRDFEPLLASGDTAAAARNLAQTDAILAQVESLDPRWIQPIVDRGWLAYHETDLVTGFDKTYYSARLSRALDHAERGLALDPASPDALELRGTMNYWRWLLNLEPDQDKAAELLAGAEADLRRVVADRPNAAVAWSWLSHLLMGQAQTAEAKLAAQNAYESDPYLSTVRTTLWRLFQSSLDLEDAAEADHWCREGKRRFPQSHRFVECQLALFALKGVKPDVPRLYELLAEYERLSPAGESEFNAHYGRMLVATALARAGLADSARSVARGARADAATDPTRDLALAEASVHMILGDHDEALRLLSTYVAANPQFRATMAKDQTWWFRDLRSDPRYRTLVGLGNTS
jgi:eukaryotic-like serine/threonine-protein kinase